MDNIPIAQVIEDEPPIYRELNPITIERYIGSSEEEYSCKISVNPSEQITEDDHHRELSAEEISSMIMMNEGPNVYSAVQEDQPRSYSSIRKSSDIKKILTSDLPKTGRFLSTKSLQRLSGLKKIKRNPKYEDESDEEEPVKKRKIVKENLPKEKKGKSTEKIMKLKKIKKVEGDFLIKKTKNLKEKGSISVSKVLKRKTLDNNIVKKKRMKYKDKFDGNKNKEEDDNITSEKLVSKSGRIRRLKNVSKELILGKKDGKILNPSPQRETISKDLVKSKEGKTETMKENKSKKKSKSNELLQNALSESVESWFDINFKTEKKRKKFSEVQMVLSDYDVVFEETLVQDEEKPIGEVQEDNIKEKKDKSEILENKGNEFDDLKKAQDGKKIENNDKFKKTRKSVVKKSIVSAKKTKGDSLIMKYKKKRRRGNNIALKNYGEKIDFSAAAPEEENIVNTRSLEIKEPVEESQKELPEIKEFSQQVTDINDLPPDSPVFSAVDNVKNVLKDHKKRHLKRSQSVEIGTDTTKVKSPIKSAEMPESLPSREKAKKIEIEKLEKRKKTKDETSQKIERKKDEVSVHTNNNEKEGKKEELIVQKLEGQKGLRGRPRKKKRLVVKKPILEVPEVQKVTRRKVGRPRKIINQEESKKEEKAPENIGEKKVEKEESHTERRKSHREIKLTPKLVDMISSSSSYRRGRRSTDETPSSPKGHDCISSQNDMEFSNLIKKTIETQVKDPALKQVQPLETESMVPTPDSIENYLQSKMDANASSLESSWEPGDLVWARFAGNPFWPGLIIKDPFSNDEYKTVKYLGRLPRPFVHVQFLADFGRRAWGPELYLMSFNGLEEFEKMKSDLPQVNSSTPKRDLVYQQAFFTPKKLEKQWAEAVKEGETLINKSKDERVTYMMIKYPLVKYAESVANGRLVPNERTKTGDTKLPQKYKKKKSLSSSLPDSGNSGDKVTSTSENAPTEVEPLQKSQDSFECVNRLDMEEKEESSKIMLKLVRSPKKGSKKKLTKSIAEVRKSIGTKIRKRHRKDVFEEDYFSSDSNSNGEKGSDSGSNGEKGSDSGSSGEKGSELLANKLRNSFLFKGVKSGKISQVCQICVQILENEKTIKCRGICQGLFHKSCAEKIGAELPPLEEGTTPVAKKKGRKRLFVDEEGDTETDSQEKEWRCNDCSRGVNPCFVCKSRSGNRQRCCISYCGKFYHQKCLKLYPQTMYNQGAPIKKLQSMQRSKAAESDSPHYQILSCPLHVCHTCASDNPTDSTSQYLFEKLVKCIKCPRAYHGGNYCVPAGSTILNTTQIICASHTDPKKKSHVNISWCFFCNMGGSLICCDWCPSSFHLDCLNIKPPEESYICEECESGRFPLYGEVVWAKLGRYRWWPAKILFPNNVPDNILNLPHNPWDFAVRFYGTNDYYWLNRGRVFLFQEDDFEQKFRGHSTVDKVYQRGLKEATKDYFNFKEERRLNLMETLNSSAAKPPPYIKIKANKMVGKAQMGSSSEVEPQTCDCDPNTLLPCSRNSNCLNRMLLVECDPNYCNAGARCQNQSFEKRQYPPLETYRTEKRGWGLRSLAYIPRGTFVIEYVGEVIDDAEFKRRMKRKQETKDNNYYFLTLDKDNIIDAGPKGNLARFMNHSCSPNCETQKWRVNKCTRVGLFALRDIPPKTELTFNYNLDCVGNEKKVCHCEEKNCSGFIGVKVKSDKYEKKRVKRLEKASEDECYICKDGGELMVCDLPNCPKVYHLECVKLKKWPNEIWFCPRHRCCICDRTTKRCCYMCPTAYCYNHLDNNMFSNNKGGLACSKHNTYSAKRVQLKRKASYVNRSTPVLENEKPFTEKSRSKDKTSPVAKKNEVPTEPNLTDNTSVAVDNPVPPSTDRVSVQVIYVDDEGEIVTMDENAAADDAVQAIDNIADAEDKPKSTKKKKRTNIPRKKLNLPLPSDKPTDETDGNDKEDSQSGIESLMIKSVEDKILDSNLSMDNIYNIIGGANEGDLAAGSGSSEMEGDTKPNKKDDLEVDRSRRSKYFKIITPEKFIKVPGSETSQKKVTDFNYIEFMHPLRSAKNKTKAEETQQK